MTTLVVVQPFGAYARGDAITDAAAVATVLAGSNRRSVVRLRAPVVAAPVAAHAAPAAPAAVLTTAQAAQAAARAAAELQAQAAESAKEAAAKAAH
jgi:SWI/SNF-related matrix-associated actin-dependent regulator 1 of chromatin subfamily A